VSPLKPFHNNYTTDGGQCETERGHTVTYPVLKFLHLLGLTLMGAGLIGVWYADLRSRQVRELPVFAEAVRSIAVLYDGLVIPGALFLLGSGTWLIVTVYGGWAFLGIPWLVGMVILFAFEFIEAEHDHAARFHAASPPHEGGSPAGEGDGGAGGSPTPLPADVHALPRHSNPFSYRRAWRDAAEHLDAIRGRHAVGACRSRDLNTRDSAPVPHRVRAEVWAETGCRIMAYSSGRVRAPLAAASSIRGLI
jgi:hypothetical protein